jgi:hypothetical protein
MAGLTKAQRAVKELEKQKAETKVEPEVNPVVKPQIQSLDEYYKFKKLIGIKKEIQEKTDMLKAKFNLDKVKEKFGVIPSVIYISGTRLIFAEEIEVTPKLAKLLTKEGLIENA